MPVATILLLATTAACARQGSLPVVRLDHDDTRITTSCTIEIEPGRVIADTNGDGVIHVAADGITIRMAPGSALRGAAAGTPWDQLTGLGVRLDGHKNVTLEGFNVHGFKVGIHVSNADGLVVRDCDLSDNFRQHLKSTPWAEDQGDWLWPHENDGGEWMTNYGGALVVERTKEAEIRGVKVRRGQNGIILDRVSDSTIVGNDCSFLSGWGLALWRSCNNTIARNALDFCVRGHSEGIYNRGQDSAGILCFEQSSGNWFLENSCTHGGDGFFGFAGKEAIGEEPSTEGPVDLATAGCNGNVIAFNDFSYAPAHGLEMTFSEFNYVLQNRFVENAICGVWGGYSRDTTLAGNAFVRNGGMAYGQERGGVNIEHGSGNHIVSNTFADNPVAIRFWWDDDKGLLELPGMKVRYTGVAGNFIELNRININAANVPAPKHAGQPIGLGIAFQDTGSGNVVGNAASGNQFAIVGEGCVDVMLDKGIELSTDAPPSRYAHGSRKSKTSAARAKTANLEFPEVVGKRSHLTGRANIIMDEWGPWDHESPLVRVVERSGGSVKYEVRGVPVPDVRFRVSPETIATQRLDSEVVLLEVRADPGVHPYELAVEAPGVSRTFRGTLVRTKWDGEVFPSRVDPREKREDWVRGADGDEAVSFAVDDLDLALGRGGPVRAFEKADPGAATTMQEKGISTTNYGLIARTRLELPKGRWRLKTLSDDGIRVSVDRRTLIDNWTHHGPTEDAAEFEQEADGSVLIEVQYFQLDGFAVLKWEIEPAGPAGGTPQDKP